ncbi:hypothetical protein AB0J72_53475 [Dactylosporangium sp. NPDC049742]|uniref:hypothetical protein n=1 Tax=Dactylosporangium sp. NPDC049742 TaxID=3154737 RepID=UPI003445BDDE
MGWLRRTAGTRFPADMLARLELMGRFEMDPVSSGEDATQIYPRCIAPFYVQAKADPQPFVSALLAAVRDDTGGFATYGASCLVVELLGTGQRFEEALELLDRAIAVKRDRGLPSAALKGYEWTRWLDKHGPGTW